MTIIDKTVWVTLTNKKLSYYEKMQYPIPKATDKYGNIVTPKGSRIEVKTEDLPKGSHYEVSVRCDYNEIGCEGIVTKEYRSVLRQRKNIEKDCCNNKDCVNIKTQESNTKNYGVKHVCQIEGAEEKRKATCVDKYGVDNPMKNPEIREKAIKTMFENLGVEYPIQNKEIKEKIAQTSFNTYGSKYPLQHEKIRKKIEQTNLNKYGVKNPLGNKEVRKKIIQTNLSKYGFEYHMQNKEQANKFSGENAPHWKNGITNLSAYMRNQLPPWVKSVLEKNNYECFISGYRGSLEVHHEKPFNIIRDEIIKELNFPIYKSIGEYTQLELQLLIDKMFEVHQSLRGFPIREDLHKLFHKLYGYDETVSLSDLLEFKQRYLIGEFKEVI